MTLSDKQPREMKILIVGSGKLVNALLEANHAAKAAEWIKWDELTPLLTEKAVVVHAGSGRQLKECLDFCAIITITESHQSSKTSEPGTAHAFARILNVPVENIISIRDPEIQLKGLGIPEEYFNNQAFHRILMADGQESVTIETKVLGHDSYVKGVRKIINAVTKHDCENRAYTVLDLIDANWISGIVFSNYR